MSSPPASTNPFEIVFEVRAQVCRACPRQCAAYASLGDRLPVDPAQACPIGKWDCYDQYCEQEPLDSGESRGLGDLVARVAQPIARVIDRVAGTDLQNCGGCKSRQAWLNRHFPTD